MRQLVQRAALLALLTILVACQTAAEDPAPEPTAAATTNADSVASTEAATAAPTAAPTDTALPRPTDTPAPTATMIPSPTPEPVMLNYLAGYGGQQHARWMQDDLAAYLEGRTDVVYDFIGSNYYSKVVPEVFFTRLDREQKMPDVVSGFIVGHLRDYVANGHIADISHLWAANGWEETFPGALTALATIAGQQYFVPQAIQWHPVFYRPDIFAANDLTPPENWEALLNSCEVLADAGVVPIAVSTSGWTAPTARFFTILNLRLNGHEFHEALMAGQASYLDPRVEAVFNAWAEMFEHRCFDTSLNSYGEAANMLVNGDAAMYFLGEWLSESYPAGFPDTIDYFPFPTLDPEVPRAEIAHIYGAYMISQTAHPEEVEAFLTYLGSVESQNSNVIATGRLVSHRDADLSSLSEMYGRGYDFVVGSVHLTQLFEFNTHPDIVEVAMVNFTNMFRSPDNIDTYMTRLENARQKVYGDVP